MRGTVRTLARVVRSFEPPSGEPSDFTSRIAALLRRTAGRVVVVHAPPGYGKTSNVAAWARNESRPVRWVDMDRGDNDPAVLLGALTSALADATDFDTAGLPSGQLLEEQYSTIVAPAFGHCVAQCPAPFILVLDDVHEVDSHPCIDLIDSLVHHVPPPSTVVLISRGETRVPLARLRVADDLIEITTADLSLDVPYADELLRSMGVELDTDAVEAIVAATEGWAVGIRLAGLAHREDPLEPDLVRGRRVDHTVSEYVGEEWLRGLDPATVEFLTEASWLDSLSGAMCNDVLDRTDADELLHRLHVDRSFVMPLGRRGSEYRMHRLLREVLLGSSASVDAARRQQVEHRASLWYEHIDDIERAIQYALRSGDAARAEQLAVRWGPRLTTQGRHATVRRWLDHFPQEQILSSGELCLTAAAAAVGCFEADTTIAWLRFGRTAAQAQPRGEVALQIDAVWSVVAAQIGDVELERAAGAHSGLGPGVYHAVAGLGYGQLCLASGDAHRAMELFRESAAESKVIGAWTLEAAALADLALAHWEGGDRPAATANARAARALVREHGLDDLPTLCPVTALSALVEAAAGHPSVAAKDIALTRRNLAYVATLSSWANVQVRIAVARASLLCGDRVAAQTFVDEAAAMLVDAAALGPTHAQLDDVRRQLRAGRSSLPDGPSSLTTAELRVLHYFPTNLTLTEIAERLYVSRNTAKSHAASVYRKLAVTSRGEAVVTARAVGLLAPSAADDVAD